MKSGSENNNEDTIKHRGAATAVNPNRRVSIEVIYIPIRCLGRMSILPTINLCDSIEEPLRRKIILKF